MPHKPLSQILDLSSAAGSAQIGVSSQSGDCSVTDEFQSTHLSSQIDSIGQGTEDLTAACIHVAVTAGCDDLPSGRGSQYCGARILAPSENAQLWYLDPDSAMGVWGTTSP